MSGFEDDFGEMAAGGGGGGGEGEDIPDPALDFLAREQEQLGELETELAPLTVSPQKSPAVIPEKLVREEPAIIREWREKQTELLRAKDEEEEKARIRLRDQAAQELADWYAQNSIQVEKLREANREAMETDTAKTFVAQMEPILPGTEWDRVSKLCDFNPKTSKNVADVSRMRSIILQLKQGPINSLQT